VRGEGHEPDTRCGTVGTSGHATVKSSIHNGLCFINRASMHGRYDSLPREICSVSWCRTEGGAIFPDRTAEVSRRHSRPGAGEAREAPQGRKAGQRIGQAATRVGRRPERRKRVDAWGGAARWHPARGRALLGLWDERAAGTPGEDTPVRGMYHPDFICRTAGYVTRMSGGVGGGRP
jgi:hypothetical protein